jgi:hypothetical protein
MRNTQQRLGTWEPFQHLLKGRKIKKTCAKWPILHVLPVSERNFTYPLVSERNFTYSSVSVELHILLGLWVKLHLSLGLRVKLHLSLGLRVKLHVPPSLRAKLHVLFFSNDVILFQTIQCVLACYKHNIDNQNRKKLRNFYSNYLYLSHVRKRTVLNEVSKSFPSMLLARVCRVWNTSRLPPYEPSHTHKGHVPRFRNAELKQNTLLRTLFSLLL